MIEQLISKEKGKQYLEDEQSCESTNMSLELG